VNRRYRKTSLLITSNESYGDWGDILAGPVLASAILDRHLHHSTTINVRGRTSGSLALPIAILRR